MSFFDHSDYPWIKEIMEGAGTNKEKEKQLFEGISAIRFVTVAVFSGYRFTDLATILHKRGKSLRELICTKIDSLEDFPELLNASECGLVKFKTKMSGL